MQSVFDRITDDLAGATLRAEPSEEAGLHPGRSAALRLGGDTVGILGELSFETAAAFEIRGRVAVGELRIDAIAPSPPRRVRYAPPPRFPAIVQDLAVTVAADRRAGDAMDAIGDAHEPLLENAELYDEYRGGSLGDGQEGLDVPADVPGARPNPHRGGGAARAGRDRDRAGSALRRGDSPVAGPPREWFARPTEEVARDLVGCALVVDAGDVGRA